jgi:RNA polymerase-binding transcription factor DksA
LLEARWQERLSTVTSLSLAYHDAAERLDGGYGVADQPESPQLRRLMREAVAARRALSDTEEALGRLSAGTYGRCEQCTGAIPAARLLQDPEARYCEPCIRQVTDQPEALPALPPCPEPRRAMRVSRPVRRHQPSGADLSRPRSDAL